jgi:hypothetical protein
MAKPRSRSKEPSALVIKLQIVAAALVPPLLLGLWLQRQGFW